MRVKSVLNNDVIEEIISNTDVAYLSTIDNDGHPYVVPMNFAYEDGIIYMHSGQKGRKIEYLQKHPFVRIAFSNSEKLAYQSENVACSYYMKYKSAIVEGFVSFIDDFETKKIYLNKIMQKYTGRNDFEYNKPAIDNVIVFYVHITNMTGKTLGY
jgi:nitroimidazol reductase NimA-like FMN-containing flavoprotein (pyridoxamine 5'-phosphate oxidase superfamily)